MAAGHCLMSVPRTRFHCCANGICILCRRGLRRYWLGSGGCTRLGRSWNERRSGRSTVFRPGGIARLTCRSNIARGLLRQDAGGRLLGFRRRQRRLRLQFVQRQHRITYRAFENLAGGSPPLALPGIVIPAGRQRQSAGENRYSSKQRRADHQRFTPHGVSSAARKSPARAINARSHSPGATLIPSFSRLVTP